MSTDTWNKNQHLGEKNLEREMEVLQKEENLND